MKTEIMALHLGLRKPQGDSSAFYLSDKEVRMWLAGLGAVYDEVLLWSNRSNIGIWFTGTNAELLVQAFQQVRKNIKDSNALHGAAATSFFTDIVEGREWSMLSFADKFQQLSQARRLAAEAGSLGSLLSPMVQYGIESLLRQPFTSTGNGAGSFETIRDQLQHPVINLPHLPYYFSLN